jgi:hypothetical protein
MRVNSETHKPYRHGKQNYDSMSRFINPAKEWA